MSSAIKQGEAKHTPGPWRVVDDGEGVIGIIGDEYVNGWKEIASLDDKGRNRQNARLIAAAPDMDLLLRALKCGVVAFYIPTGELRFSGLMYSSHRGGWSKLVASVGRENIEAAITKATT